MVLGLDSDDDSGPAGPGVRHGLAGTGVEESWGSDLVRDVPGTHRRIGFL